MLQQMRQRGKEVCAELERRNKGSSGSWWEPEKSEWQEEQEAEEMQQMTEELQTLEVQVAAVHPKVEREAERLQNMAQLAALGQDSGRATGWRKEEEQAEACRVRAIKQLKRKLKIQPGDGGSWR